MGYKCKICGADVDDPFDLYDGWSKCDDCINNDDDPFDYILDR